MPNVREIMTAAPTTVAADTTITGVAERMRDDGIGMAVVTDGDNVLGVVTDRDLVVRALAEGTDPSTRVGDVLSGVTVSVSPDDDVQTAVSLMRERAVRRLPVVEKGRLLGVVSLGDVAVERDSRSALADISAATPNT